MNPSQRMHVQIAFVALVVAVLGVANWILEPERATKWLLAMATMGVVWIVVLGVNRAGLGTPTTRGFLAASAATAGILLSVPLAFALLEAAGVGGGAQGDRAQGVVIGVVLMAMGNVLPKVVPSLAAKRCAAAQTLAVQRFAGWAFFMGGLGYAGAWVFLAPAQAKPVAVAVCAAATALVMVRLAWLIATCNRKPSPI
jgi:hypothetical protein